MVEKPIKIILAILFFICLADLPYGYFQFIRFVALIGFTFLCYQSYERKEFGFAIAFGALAILFQPFFKISLGREIWNWIDVFVAIGLLVSVFLKPRKMN